MIKEATNVEYPSNDSFAFQLSHKKSKLFLENYVNSQPKHTINTGYQTNSNGYDNNDIQILLLCQKCRLGAPKPFTNIRHYQDTLILCQTPNG